MIDFQNAFDNPHTWECPFGAAFVNHAGAECHKLHYGVPWPPGDPDTWPVWHDGLGQPIAAGDYVAIATVSGRSPQMLLSKIDRINRRKSDGSLVSVSGYYYRTKDGTGTWRQDETVTIPSCTVNRHSGLC